MSERKTIYLCLAHMSEEGVEQKYVKEAFDTNWVVPLGPNVNGFEADLEAFVNSGCPVGVGHDGSYVRQILFILLTLSSREMSSSSGTRSSES